MIARVVQFALAVAGRLTARDRAFASEHLSAGERRLFEALSPAEQAHAVRVARKAAFLAEKRGVGPDGRAVLVKAALLHDIGKCDAVGPFDKVLIVLAGRFLPGLSKRLCALGERRAGRTSRRSPAASVARAFYFNATHPERGADMAAKAGCDPRVARLIRDHHAPDRAEDELLQILSLADRAS